MAKQTTTKTPRGIRNNNPLNIRRSANNWLGKLPNPTDREFEQFDTMEHGIRAAYIIIRTYIRRYHCDNLSKILHRFAPSSENDTLAYITNVSLIADIYREEPLRFERRSQMSRLLYAMHIIECGHAYIPFSEFDRIYCLYFL